MNGKKPPKIRCWDTDDLLAIRYHDREWGTPLHNDRKLFEFLILEGFQAGLSWMTILRKRENFKRAFDGFDFMKIALYDQRKIASLMKDEGIIRNRLKIASAVTNARAFLEVRKEFGSFDAYIWGFVDGKPLDGRLKGFDEMPAHTELSDRISQDLKKRGFKFIGSTVVYAHMQATGMVNDHLRSCYRYKELRDAADLDRKK
jgi:DNA-3-methyladenine glycosylase I